MNIYHGHYDAAGCTKQAMQAAKKARTDKGSQRAAHYYVRKKKYRIFCEYILHNGKISVFLRRYNA